MISSGKRSSAGPFNEYGGPKVSQRLKLRDSNGNVYIAYKTAGQRYESADAPSNGTEDNDESPRYELEDGRALNHRAHPDEFEIAETGERLTRINPP